MNRRTDLIQCQRRRPLSLLFAAALAALGAGCGGEDVALEEDAGAADPEGGHPMPLGDPGAPMREAPAGAHLEYYGGPVISSVKVWTVYWGPKVNQRDQLDSFYQAVTGSAYFDWLDEYDTPKQKIGRGGLGGSLVDEAAPSGALVRDAEIRDELKRLIDAGKLPPNDGDNLYMVHFPPGVTIEMGGSRSCEAFCAYHGTFTKSRRKVYYGVVPDMGGGCAGGCGGGSALDRATAVSSHELVEAVTDAAVGLARGLATPLAWYDAKNGEIGDICHGKQGRIAGYAVQAEWSNRASACIVTRGKAGPSDFSLAVTPASRSIARGQSATYTVQTSLTSGAGQAVIFSLAGLPAGVTASFSPPSVAAGGTTTLTVKVASGARAGKKQLHITGSASSGSRAAVASLTVTK